jgi:hypothetical protein
MVLVKPKALDIPSLCGQTEKRKNEAQLFLIN